MSEKETMRVNLLHQTWLFLYLIAPYDDLLPIKL